jgi:hypothetical protein
MSEKIYNTIDEGAVVDGKIKYWTEATNDPRFVGAILLRVIAYENIDTEALHTMFDYATGIKDSHPNSTVVFPVEVHSTFKQIKLAASTLGNRVKKPLPMVVYGPHVGGFITSMINGAATLNPTFTNYTKILKITDTNIKASMDSEGRRRVAYEIKPEGHEKALESLGILYRAYLDSNSSKE